MFHGETLDTIANVIAWFALIIAPPVLTGGWNSPAMPLRYAESAQVANDGVRLD